MATVTVTAANKGRTRTAVAERAARATELATMYSPLAKAIKAVGAVAVQEDEASGYLVVQTNDPRIQIQVSHPTEILRLSEDELNEWAILWGDFSEAVQKDEYLPGNTTASNVAKRVDALLRELNAAAQEAPAKPKRAIARKAPAVEPEPVVEAPKAKKNTPVKTATATKVRALPTRSKK